jgi:hypothetical protein
LLGIFWQNPKDINPFEFMTDERTTAYLLNELPPHEAEQFEEECFSQPEWPEDELTSAEEDLIHAYIKKELSPDRRRRFKKHYLTTKTRKQKVARARAFQQLVCPVQPKPRWTQKVLDFLKAMVFPPENAVLRIAGIVLAAGLATTSLWFAFRTTSPKTFAHLNLAISTHNRADGGSTQTVNVPLAEDALRISLALPERTAQGATYRVQWENVKGPIGNLDIEKQDANAISVIIPAGKLTPGQYVLKLFRKNSDGTEESVPGNYLFNAD